MFIQMAPVQQVSTPKVAAVFYAANSTLDKALIYDVSIIEPDSNHENRHANRKSRAHVIKKGNYYSGTVNPTERTVPAGLTKTAAHR